MHWTQHMAVPVRLGLAADSASDLAALRALRAGINKEWYPPGQRLKNIPCGPATIFTHFGVSLADPSNIEDPDIVTRICGNASQPGPLGARPGVLSSFEDVTEVYSTAELDAYLESQDYATSASKPQLWAAVVFHGLPGGGAMGAAGAWSYSIRMNRTLFGQHGPHIDVPSTTAEPVTPGWQHGAIELGNQDVYAGSFPRDSDAGFMTLQLLLDRYIINAPTATGAKCAPPTFGKKKLPPKVAAALAVDCALLGPEGLALNVGQGGAPPSFLGGGLFQETLGGCDLAKCLQDPDACAACKLVPNSAAESAARSSAPIVLRQNKAYWSFGRVFFF
jgi:hypothetical protein